MGVLFSSRVNLTVIGDLVTSEAGWPLGKLAFDDDRVTVGGVLWSYHLDWAEIDCFQSIWFGFGVVIKHHAPQVPSLVRASGIYLFRRLEDAVQSHQLAVHLSR